MRCWCGFISVLGFLIVRIIFQLIIHARSRAWLTDLIDKGLMHQTRRLESWGCVGSASGSCALLPGMILQQREPLHGC